MFPDELYREGRGRGYRGVSFYVWWIMGCIAHPIGYAMVVLLIIVVCVLLAIGF